MDVRSRNSKHASGFTVVNFLGIFVHMNAFIFLECSIILVLIFDVETALGRSHGPTVRSPIQTAWLQSPRFKGYSGRLSIAGKHAFFSRRGGEFSCDTISPGEERDTKIGIHVLDSFKEDKLVL